jgi:hypothetical protein
LASLLIAILASPVRAADGQFAGTFKSDRMTMKLERDAGSAGAGEAYTGAIEMGANKFPVRAEAKDGKLKGTFKDKGGQSFEFTATLSGDDMTLVTSGTPLPLKRQAAPPATPPVNPLAGLGSPTPPGPATAPAAAAASAQPVNPLDPPKPKPQNPLEGAASAGGGEVEIVKNAAARTADNPLPALAAALAGGGTTAPTTAPTTKSASTDGGTHDDGDGSGLPIVILIIVIIAVLGAGGVAIAYALKRKRAPGHSA